MHTDNNTMFIHVYNVYSSDTDKQPADHTLN